MRRFRSFVFLQLPLLTTAGFLLSGALAQQNAPARQTPPATLPAPAPASKSTTVPPAPPPKADPNAIAALNKAINSLDSRKLGLLDTKIWEQVDTLGLTFQADGAYLSGPKDRMRLELKLKLANTNSKLLVVSDGAWVWNQVTLGKEQPLTTKFDLREVQKQLNAPNTMPTLVEDFYRSQSFRGVVPLLQNLSQQMTFTKLESATWKGEGVYKLTGVWSADFSKQLSQPGQAWPLFTPRTCTLFLASDKSNPAYWPLRLEWWGPGSSGHDNLLMQMEFRDPHIVAAGAEVPGKYAAAFAFDPGKAEVADMTKGFVEGITRARNAQATQRPGGGSAPKQ